MKKSRFREAQIVGILKEVELGAKVGDTCRKHGISDATGKPDSAFRRKPMIFSSVNLFFMSNLLLHGIGLQAHLLLNSGGRRGAVDGHEEQVFFLHRGQGVIFARQPGDEVHA